MSSHGDRHPADAYFQLGEMLLVEVLFNLLARLLPIVILANRDRRRWKVLLELDLLHPQLDGVPLLFQVGLERVVQLLSALGEIFFEGE